MEENNYPKQVIVMRTDLNMRKGKIAAQAAHASLSVILRMMNIKCDDVYETRTMVIDNNSAIEKWLNGSFTKICVGVNSELELLDLYDAAIEANIPASLIIDNGKTEFNGIKTVTCIAIGPDYSDRIDAITGHLKLL